MLRFRNLVGNPAIQSQKPLKVLKKLVIVKRIPSLIIPLLYYFISFGTKILQIKKQIIQEPFLKLSRKII